MISDVLFEAIEEIERYQADMPICYDTRRIEIDRVKEEMRNLQHRLDIPVIVSALPEEE